MRVCGAGLALMPRCYMRLWVLFVMLPSKRVWFAVGLSCCFAVSCGLLWVRFAVSLFALLFGCCVRLCGAVVLSCYGFLMLPHCCLCFLVADVLRGSLAAGTCGLQMLLHIWSHKRSIGFVSFSMISIGFIPYPYMMVCRNSG